MEALRKIGYGAGIALLVFVVFKVLAEGFRSAMNITETPYEPPPPAKWHQVASWAGQGVWSTEDFNVPGDRWRITWNTAPGQAGATVFKVDVYYDNGQFVGTAAQSGGVNRGTQTIEEGGWFFLSVQTGQRWELSVMAYY